MLKNIIRINVASLAALPQSISTKRQFSREVIGQRSSNPWDYNKKPYGLWGQMFDSTAAHLTENSLIISVEGNFGAGKTAFAKKLAAELDFKYASEPCLEKHLFLLENGGSMRDIINEHTEGNALFHSDNLEDWHKKATFKATAEMQVNFYMMRWMQMRTALLHLLSTGQGVVLERTAFSDEVITESLHENHMLSDEAYNYYKNDLRYLTISDLWKPHVHVYIEKTPEDCFKTIKLSSKEYERTSNVYSMDLLKTVEDKYKRNFLPAMENSGYVLKTESNLANTQTVIDDLELLNFEDKGEYANHVKFPDWLFNDERQISQYRKKIANYEYCTRILLSTTGWLGVPELCHHGGKAVEYMKCHEDDPRTFPKQSNYSFFTSGKPKHHIDWL